MKRYRITPTAQRDIYGVLAHLADEANVEVAKRYQKLFKEAFVLLGDYPHLGHIRKDITHRPLRFYQVKPYLVIYSVRETFVLVQGVFHGAQDGKALIRKRKT